MGTDERNFRYSYYEKVGCFSVEEKKSLNILLQDDIRNLSKLKQFCLSYSVPSAHRALLWSLIMGILPLHKRASDFVREQRRQVYEDLQHAVTIMRYVEVNTTKELMLYTMWLLENNRLLHNNHTGAGTKETDQQFIEIVRVLLQTFEDDVETYWIAKKFYAYTREIHQDSIKLKELTQQLLKREDIELFHHLGKLGVFERQCKLLDGWYSTCFADVISESVLMKVWDKISGGSRKVVVFLFLELVKDVRQSIFNCNEQSEFKTLIQSVKDQDAVIINKAIKTWQSNKNHGEIEY